jgi:hypothetical protein
VTVPEQPSGLKDTEINADALPILIQETTQADNAWIDVAPSGAFAHGHDAVRWLTTRPGCGGVLVWDNGTAET